MSYEQMWKELKLYAEAYDNEWEMRTSTELLATMERIERHVSDGISFIKPFTEDQEARILEMIKEQMGR